MLDHSQPPRYKLLKVKELIVLKKVTFCLHRQKNRETLKLLGLETEDALNVIMHLKKRDFFGVDRETGKADADVYLKTIQKMRVYIKFRIERPKNLIVISFHQDEAKGGIRKCH